MLTRNALADAGQRFAEDVAALTGASEGHRFGLAVSGGPDSVALLLLAESAYPGRIEAATVDHKLRKASKDEAKFVAGLCGERGIPHEVLPLEGLKRGNVSAAARDARYDALDAWAERQGLNWLLTAHHADDQLETLIMRLNRASGVAGLAGVRRRRGRIIRPLLGWRREELGAIVAASGIAAVDDPSNRDDRYDRARMRKALGEAGWLDPVAAAFSASALGEADEALDWVIVKLRDAHFRQGADFWSYNANGLPRELMRRALVDCLALIDPDCRPRGEAVERALVRLQSGEVTTMGKLVIAGVGGSWAFKLAPPRKR